MISTSDFKRGTKILFRNEPYSIVDFMHVKPGKGGAYVRTKMKNLISGLVHEETFRSGEKFPNPDLEYKKMQYLYNEGDQYNFMDQESYDQVILSKKQLDDVLKYLKEQVVYDMIYFQAKPISVNPPLFMELEVKETPPGVKGDTAQGGGNKPATMDTGLVLQVPLFINEGDILKIDTRTDEYIERVKK